MEQMNAKRAIIFAVATCLIGMLVGSAVTLAVLNVLRAVLLAIGDAIVEVWCDRGFSQE